MNLLSLIIIFLAIVICVAVAYIAWQLTADVPERHRKPEQAAPRPDSAAGQQEHDRTPPGG